MRSLAALVQFPDCLAGLESAEATSQQVECTEQDQGQDWGKEEETSETEAAGHEQEVVDWVTEGYLVSCPD